MSGSKYVPLLLIAATSALVGCEPRPATAPEGAGAGSDISLLECPAAQPQTFSGNVGLLGGVLSGAGVRVIIPAGALLGLTELEVRVPASPYAEIEVTANGQEHFQFLQPVIMSIDYSRCGNISGPMSVWHIDTETKTLLENMGGINDILGRRMIFSTLHLSGYAIVN